MSTAAPVDFLEGFVPVCWNVKALALGLKSPSPEAVSHNKKAGREQPELPGSQECGGSTGAEAEPQPHTQF